MEAQANLELQVKKAKEEKLEHQVKRALAVTQETK